MSQVFHQSQNSNWSDQTVFPLIKFSHSTSPVGNKFSWEHISYKTDIELILREVRLSDHNVLYQDPVVLRITSGTELLEEQNLTDLVRICRDYHSSTLDEHPVNVVVKTPFMAMKYPKSANTVRRIQIKFRTDLDFIRACDILGEIGLPITDKGLAAPSIPQQLPSPAPTMFSMASTPYAVASIGDGPKLVPSPLQHSKFKVPPRPDSAISESLLRQTATPKNSYESARVIKPPPPLFNLSTFTGSSPTRMNSSKQPGPHSSYISQFERESQLRRLSYPTTITPSQAEHKSLTTTSQISSQAPSFSTRFIEREKAIPRELSTSPFFSSSKNHSITASPTSRPPSDHQRSHNERPSSTPLANTSSDPLWIPPKRELPFNKPREFSKSPSLPDLPPLPKPTLKKMVDIDIDLVTHKKEIDSPLPIPTFEKKAGVHTELATCKDKINTPPQKIGPARRVANRKPSRSKKLVELESASESAREQSLVTPPKPKEDEESPLVPKPGVAVVRPASAAAILVSKAAAQPRKRQLSGRPQLPAIKRPKMADASTQTQTLSGRDHTSALIGGQTTALPAAAVGPPDLPALLPELPPPPTSPPSDFLNDIDNFVSKHKARPAPRQLWENTVYVTSDDEQRYLMLNDFICENLENEDFLQLCQDSEKAWRRIGLGM